MNKILNLLRIFKNGFYNFFQFLIIFESFLYKYCVVQGREKEKELSGLKDSREQQLNS